MSLALPKLDDKTYAELVDEARAALPAIHPGWTDYNPSDPGIALVELLAWLTEMLVYRTGRISEKSERTFLRLLSAGAHGAPDDDLESATEATLRELRALYRAVAPNDFVTLVESTWPTSPEAAALEAAGAGSSSIARIVCVPERDLSGPAPKAEAAGHVSLIVVPDRAPEAWIAPSADLLAAVGQFFHDRILITTRLHVVGPTPVPIELEATLGLRDDTRIPAASVPQALDAWAKQGLADDALAAQADVRARAIHDLIAHFHPRKGGAAGQGWPFGRDVDLSELFALLDGVPGVEFVEALTLTAEGDAETRTVLDPTGGEVLGIRLEAHELPRFDAAKITLIFKARRGGKWIQIA